MTPTTVSNAYAMPARSPRWILLGSLAFNLFFIGVAAAFLIREPAAERGGVASRIEQVASSLPPADAARLRADFRTDRAKVEAARANFESAREAIRAALRREPFDVAAMRDAMNQARVARQEFDQRLQDLIAKSASDMSPAGRQGLAEWPSGSRPPH